MGFETLGEGVSGRRRSRPANHRPAVSEMVQSLVRVANDYGFDTEGDHFRVTNAACHDNYGNAKATNASPALLPSFPAPPAAITTYWRPLAMYVEGVA